MNKKIPIFLLLSLTPILFFSTGFQNNQNFEIGKNAEFETKSGFANFTTNFDFEVDNNINSFNFEWNDSSKIETRKLKYYWFDERIIKKIYSPGEAPKINPDIHSNQFCQKLEYCQNWQYYWDERKFRNWNNETIFNVYGQYDSSIFDLVSLKINAKNQKILEISNKLSKFAKEKIEKLKNDFGAFEIKVANLLYRVGFEITANKIKKFTASLQFYYTYREPSLLPNNELTNYLNKLKTKFNTEVIKDNKILLPSTQENQNNSEIKNISLRSTPENLQKIKEKIPEFEKKLVENNEQKKYNSYLSFRIIDDNKLEFFLVFKHPQDQNYYNFVLNNNVAILFELKNVKNEDQFWKRLTITPGQVYDPNDQTIKIDVPDQILKPKKTVEKKENIRYINGGKWEYHSKARLNFIADPEENEILFINDKPIDVLDRNFDYELEDLRLEQKQAQSANNEYKIQIKKFEKNHETQDNSKVIAIYEINLVIKSVNSIMDIKWFAWNPANNKEQQELIEPYLKDEKGNVISDEFGKKVKNPKFDPLIDPKTGTKKQILWVSTGSNPKNLPKNSVFLQLPNELNNWKRNRNSNFGFIAEASVSGKGANITLNKLIKNEKNSSQKFSINTENLEKFEIKEKNNEKSNEFVITKSANKYFSSSGIWLFSSKFDKGNSSFKLVSIGNNSNSQLFTDIFPNKAIIPFWDSEPGQFLMQYLLELKFSQDDLEKLSYEEILLHWKNFIENSTKKYWLRKVNSQIKSIELIKNRISSIIKKKEKTQNDGKNTGKILEIKPEMIDDLVLMAIDDEELIGKISTKITNIKENNDGSFDFEIEFEAIDLDRNLESSFQKNTLGFKNIKVENEDFSEIKEKISLNVDKKLLLKSEDADDYGQIIEEFSKQNNSDKVDIVIEKNPDGIFANFKIKKEYNDKFYLEKPFILLRKLSKNQNIEENSTNIFKNLNIDSINLARIKSSDEAKNFILSEIQKSWKNTEFQYNIDYQIADFDKIVENAIKNIEENEQLPHKIWNLKLTPKQNSNQKFYGVKNIRLVNIVGSLRKPKIKNLSEIKVKQFGLSISKYSENLENAIKDHVYNLLLPENIDAKKYLHLKNLSEIAHDFKNNPNLDKATLILEPGSFQLNGTKKLTVFNSDFSPSGVLDSENSSKNSTKKGGVDQKSTWYWLIPLILFSGIGLVFASFWIYNKFIAKFKH
ncbi:Mbov_0399 family ICE element protein [Mycoplasma sp. 'Moose RK']|uniref:Mbov_0399 family ICE element protein n=1 Tax=Mycoplasma sp. 'Moose RK' TaxID=2780095 RepID=UPI0018C259DF|nr:hypothetical protein [Mycoplasma sp. 'Moose RK']MBG0730578.1 hypothetical protein [Mycoplasma sp. 'Moose RK']